MSHVIHDLPTDHSPDAPANGDQLARQQAIRQIKPPGCCFWITATWSAIAMVILVVIWATTEYHNAGGWPVHGLTCSWAGTGWCAWRACSRARWPGTSTTTAFRS